MSWISSFDFISELIKEDAIRLWQTSVAMLKRSASSLLNPVDRIALIIGHLIVGHRLPRSIVLLLQHRHLAGRGIEVLFAGVAAIIADDLPRAAIGPLLDPFPVAQPAAGFAVFAPVDSGVVVKQRHEVAAQQAPDLLR
jgi:hypothetical protein